MNFLIWEPFYLFGGAPPAKLKVEFLHPKPSPVDQPVNAGEQLIEATQLNFIDLAGHSLFQLGVAFENYLFLADAFFLLKFGKNIILFTLPMLRRLNKP